ncbi:hypothetical protein MJO28_003731 [Puccinia striiformis f. sp. tritici]|uniref:Uncharacterized protein n=1 Tax=Puccinia striiformis f. sp. tritici TaxID=168172 RepID=A0ACC0EMF4_9BASI|nr:hypothetical protein MJO28_003731 [Puccinia striiformis f. sp. tritici]
MLLTKILVALQTLHCYGVSAHPLALLKSLVKRAEGMTTPFLDKLQNFEEHTGPLQGLQILILDSSDVIQLKCRKTEKQVGSPAGSIVALVQDIVDDPHLLAYERDASGEGEGYSCHSIIFPGEDISNSILCHPCQLGF